ncbi:sensor histidine kinase [Eubacterium callanderi]|uniref:sensor histidine kinase n=1 Tax=Eubacterium callanderi TaxID=53442 RepID=UPI00391A1C41
MTNAEILFEILRFIPQSFASIIILDFIGFLADSPLNYKSKKTWLSLLLFCLLYTTVFIYITYFVPQTVFVYALRIVFTLLFFSVYSLIYFHKNYRVLFGGVIVGFLSYILTSFLFDFCLFVLAALFPSLEVIVQQVTAINFDTIFIILVWYNLPAMVLLFFCLLLLKKFKMYLISFFYRMNFLYLFFLFAVVALLITLNLQASYVQRSGRMGISELLFSIVIIALAIALLDMIRTKGKLILFNQEEKQLSSYISSLEKILNEKREVQHDYKNQLLILQGFLKEKKYLEAEKYLSSIFPTENIDSQFRGLNILSTGGLKGLIYLKLYDLKKAGITVDILSGKKITSLDQETLGDSCYYDLCKIIGILLDNAIEACKLTNKKEILLEIYEKEDISYISITNTYTGTIYPSLLNQYGYSTKGKGRGYGLYIVSKLLKKHKNLLLNTTFDDLYFTQTVEIR